MACFSRVDGLGFFDGIGGGYLNNVFGFLISSFVSEGLEFLYYVMPFPWCKIAKRKDAGGSHGKGDEVGSA